jgi:hypothetical protein
MFGDHQAPDESRADAFARHLLVPADGLCLFLSKRFPVNESVLSDVVQRYLASPDVAATALHDVECLDGDMRQKWMGLPARTLATRFGWSDYYNGLQCCANRPRAPQHLLARAITGYIAGVVSTQTIATLRDTELTNIEAELHEAGIEPGYCAATQTHWPPTRSSQEFHSFRVVSELDSRSPAQSER